MAAVGAEVTSSCFLLLGVAGFILLLLLLSIFLTSLCSDCGRHSFELHDSSVEKDPPSLIKVVKLEDAMMARENPMIDKIQSDEKDVRCDQGNRVLASASRSHLGEPQLNQEVKAEEISSVQLSPWRCHLTEAHSQDHIYHTIGGAQAAPSPATNHEPCSAAAAEDLSSSNVNSVYAQVSKKVTKTTPTTTVHSPAQVEEEEEELPPLPGRTTDTQA